MAYSFMTGYPSRFGGGFSMMDPETLRKQRFTYVKYWLRKLEKDMADIAAAAKKD